MKKELTFLTSAPSRLSYSLLPSSFVVYLLAPQKDIFRQKLPWISVSWWVHFSRSVLYSKAPWEPDTAFAAERKGNCSTALSEWERLSIERKKHSKAHVHKKYILLKRHFILLLKYILSHRCRTFLCVVKAWGLSNCVRGVYSALKKFFLHICNP